MSEGESSGFRDSGREPARLIRLIVSPAAGSYTPAGCRARSGAPPARNPCFAQSLFNEACFRLVALPTRVP